MTQTMTKEQILEKHSTKLTDGTCICSKTSRLRAMQEYAQQEVSKEREKAKKIEHALKMCVDALKGLDATDYVAYTAGKVALIEYNNH